MSRPADICKKSFDSLSAMYAEALFLDDGSLSSNFVALTRSHTISLTLSNVSSGLQNIEFKMGPNELISSIISKW